jgi:hypothetical protein
MPGGHYGHASPPALGRGHDARELDDFGSAGEAGALSIDPPEAGAFIWPQTVTDAKTRIAAEMQATKRDVDGCAALSAAEKAAFQDFYISWRQFFCRDQAGQCTAPDVSIWGLGSQMDEAEAFEGQLASWQAQIGAKCALSAPPAKPPAGPTDWSSLAMWGAIGVASILGLAVLAQVAPWIPKPKGRR